VSRVDVKTGVKVEEIAEMMVVVYSGVNLHDERRLVDENVTLRRTALTQMIRRDFDEISQLRSPDVKVIKLFFPFVTDAQRSAL
jgi:hypothetical protein